MIDALPKNVMKIRKISNRIREIKVNISRKNIIEMS